jgi:hypothetical protein
MKLLLDQNLSQRLVQGAELLVTHAEHIEAFAADPAESVLFLG